MENTNKLYSKSTVVVIDDAVWTSCCDVMNGIEIGRDGGIEEPYSGLSLLGQGRDDLSKMKTLK